LTETVRLVQRLNGSPTLVCATTFAQQGRDAYRPLARADAAGIWLWCRSCDHSSKKGNRGVEHCLSWPQTLRVMERFLDPQEFLNVLAQAAHLPGSHGPPRR
jgi:hypothetical protein